MLFYTAAREGHLENGWAGGAGERQHCSKALPFQILLQPVQPVQTSSIPTRSMIFVNCTVQCVWLPVLGKKSNFTAPSSGAGQVAL